MGRWWLLLVVVAGCHAGHAVVRETPAPTGPTVTVLRGVRLIDGSGAPPVENATLVIEGQALVDVGESYRVKVPANARVFDLAGKTVMPGLVADHSHLGMTDGTDAGPGHGTRQNILRQLRQLEAYGVTTVTSLGMNGAVFYALQPELHRGALPGADIYGADRGIGVSDGAPPVDVEPDRMYRVTTVDEARAAVKETATRHPDLVKIWVDDFHGSLKKKMPPEVYRAVIDEAHRQGLRVAAHVYYLDDAKRLVADGVDILAHGIRDRPVDAELIAAMKAKHTWYIPTLDLDEASFIYAEAAPFMRTSFFRHSLQPALVAQLDDNTWRTKTLDDTKKVAADKQSLAMNMANVKTLSNAGIDIGFGTDSGANPLRIHGFAEHRELELLVKAGLTPLEAIRTATSRAAKLLDLDDRGTLIAGKLADFIVVDGNPSRDIADVSRIVEVWHRGKKVSSGIFQGY